MKFRLAVFNLFAILFIVFISGCVPKAVIAPSGEGLEMVLRVKPGKSDELRKQYAELVLAEMIKGRLEAININRSSVETGDDATVIVRTSALKSNRLFIKMIGNPILLAMELVDEDAGPDTIFAAGNYIKSVEMEKDPFKKKYLLVQLNLQGSRLLADYTARHRGKRVAVTIDGWAYFNAMIQEKIMGGRLIVKGFPSDEEAEALEIILEAGPYSEDVEVLSLTSY